MGIYKKWLMWAMLLPTYFFSYFHRTSTSIVAVELSTKLGLTGMITGMFAATYFYAYSIMQIPTGILADTLGPRKIVFFGGFIMGCGTIAFAISDSLPLAIISRFLIGFGASFNFVSLLKIQNNWFDKKDFPLLTGLSLFIGNLGASFGVGPFSYIANLITWQKCFLIFGVLSIIFSIIILIFVRDYPDNYKKENNDFSIRKTMIKILKNKNNYLTFLAIGLPNGTYMTIASLWGVPFLMHTYHINQVTASVYISFLPLGVMTGCFFNGLMSKIFKGERKAVLTLLTTAGVFWALITFIKFPDNLVFLYPYILFLTGFFLSSLNLIFTTVTENNSKEISGTALSFTNIGGFLVISIMQPLSGWILDLSIKKSDKISPQVYPYHSYQTMLILLLIIHFIAVLSFYLIKPAKNKNTV